MPNLDTLNTVIAIIVVLLVLSLIVQAIQSFIKKMFKLKSREIEKSLSDLFEHVIDTSATPPPTDSTPAAASDTTALTTNAASTDPASRKVAAKELVETVLGEFKRVGRYSKRGRLVLDSISKEDLLKILARVDSKHFYADYVTKFQAMYTDIAALEGEINKLVANKPPLLQGAASAKFAEMQAVLSPLINDVKNIVSGNTVKPDTVFGDLINLRRVKLDDALQLLSAAQDSIASDLKEARAANNTVTVGTLELLSNSLATIAGIIGQLSQRMDAAFATLRTKLDHVEMWYDTVMQSFEERYTRHMKSVALYISIAVVVFLNASFFRLYHSIATNDLQRALIVSEGEQIIDQSKADATGNNANRSTGGNAVNSNNGNRANSANTNVARNAVPTAANVNTNANASPDNTNTGTAAPGVSPSPSPASTTPTPAAPAADEPAVTTQELEQQRAVIDKYVDTYEGFGFAPLTWQQVKTWTSGFVTNPFSDAWWAERRLDFSTLVGWALMVLLLSVGAPFWQDTLESLFGFKNLLRKKSDTKNVEKESGAGQPRQ